MSDISYFVAQLVSRVWLFTTPWTAAHRFPCPSLSPPVCSNPCPLSQWCHPTISSSVAPLSSCPQSFPASGSFPNESALHIMWPKYWSFGFSISPSNEFPRGLQQFAPGHSPVFSHLFWIMSLGSILKTRPELLPCCSLVNRSSPAHLQPHGL